MSRTLTLRSCVMALAALVWLLPLTACSGKQESGPTASQETMASPESAEPAEPMEAEQGEQAADSTLESGAVAESQAPPARVETPPPSPAATSKMPAASGSPGSPSGAQTAEPPPTASATPEPAPPPAGQMVAVPATKPGLTRVGAERCKLCHRTEYDSWAASAHAARKPPLDCESCHGPGSEYARISIMKDPEAARAAGLVIPEKSFCTESCHAKKWQDDMLQRAHAHKAKATQG